MAHWVLSDTQNQPSGKPKESFLPTLEQTVNKKWNDLNFEEN